MPRPDLITADDRTGALEVGGVLAQAGIPTAVGSRLEGLPADISCIVLDLKTRHLSPSEAAAKMVDVAGSAYRLVGHKMDSVLRGNWPHEVKALAGVGVKAAIVPSFPDAGRVCRDGVVYVNDLAVADSPFGHDPFAPVRSSRPADFLFQVGCTGDVVVLDATTNAELAAAVEQSLDEDRVLLGPAGPFGVLAARLAGDSVQRPPPRLPGPVLVVCGSLTALSRAQISATGYPVRYVHEATAGTIAAVDIVASPLPHGPPDPDHAERWAERLAEFAWSTNAGTIVVIGGDTADALLQDQFVRMMGLAGTALPVGLAGERTVVSKGGGIGTTDTINELLALID